MAVDAAELVAGLDHPGGAPAQRHVPSRQRLTLTAWSRPIEIIDSMQLVERSVRARVGDTPRRSTVSVSCEALAQAGRRAGVGAVEFLGQGQQGFGQQRGLGVVGIGHLASHSAAKSLWQRIFHVIR